MNPSTIVCWFGVVDECKRGVTVARFGATFFVLCFSPLCCVAGMEDTPADEVVSLFDDGEDQGKKTTREFTDEEYDACIKVDNSLNSGLKVPKPFASS